MENKKGQITISWKEFNSALIKTDTLQNLEKLTSMSIVYMAEVQLEGNISGEICHRNYK